MSYDPAEKWLLDTYLQYFESYSLKEEKETRTKIRTKVFEEIRKLIVFSGHVAPPFQPEKIAIYRNVSKIIPDENIGGKYEAILIPDINGFIIKFDPKLSRVRIRFNVSHEIGHTFFYDIKINPPLKRYKIEKSKNWVEEDYANAIAREILLPEPYFSKICLTITKIPSINALRKLKIAFNVSFEVLFRRLLHDAHRYNSIFWQENLWNARVIYGEVTVEDKNEFQIKGGVEKLKSMVSPSFKNILKDFKENKQIINFIGTVLSQEKEYSDLIEIKNKQYLLQGIRLSEKPKKIIVICSDYNKVRNLTDGKFSHQKKIIDYVGK